MTGNATKTNCASCAQYDWRSWSSWRSMLATAAMMGFMTGAAALAAETVVRDGLGLEIGGPPFAVPDLLTFAVALAMISPVYWFWIRVLKTAEDGVGDRANPPPKPLGSKPVLLEAALFLCWFFAAFAVYLFLYHGTNWILANPSEGRVSTTLAPFMMVAGVAAMRAGLLRLGAMQRPSSPVGQ